MRAPRNSRYADLRAFLDSSGEPQYRLNQIIDAVYRRGIVEYAEMTALPRGLRARLVERFGPAYSTLRPIARESADQVEKVLFENRSGARVETVLSRYRSGWNSLCVSSQVGCGLGCTFCATGAVGLVRNLTADEIGDQVLEFRRRVPITSVAFMGMGEALANPHTFEALETLTDKGFFGLAPRRITVSTVGFLPGLRRLVAEHPKVTMTLSVHSPYDEERAELIPLQNRFPLRECLEVLDTHAAEFRRKTYLAYLLIKGLNDSRSHAYALADIVRGLRTPELFHVSVIGYNEAEGVTREYRAPGRKGVRDFLDALAERGVHATHRQQFGGRLAAACGQLHARYLQSPTFPKGS